MRHAKNLDATFHCRVYNFQWCGMFCIFNYNFQFSRLVLFRLVRVFSFSCGLLVERFLFYRSVSCCAIFYVLNAFVDFPWKLMKLERVWGGVEVVAKDKKESSTVQKRFDIWHFPFPPRKGNENGKKHKIYIYSEGERGSGVRKFVIAVAKIKCKSTNSI